MAPALCALGHVHDNDSTSMRTCASINLQGTYTLEDALLRLLLEPHSEGDGSDGDVRCRGIRGAGRMAREITFL